MTATAETSNHYPAPGEKLGDHPVAQIFPMMSAPEKAELAESIKLRGLREPIVLLDGKILDGRNRWEACVAVGVEPKFRFYDPRTDGKSPTDYVMDENLNRRQLTPSQRAAIAAEAIPFYAAEAKERQRRAGVTHAANLKSAATPSTAAPVDELDQRPAVNPEDESQEQRRSSTTPKGGGHSGGGITPPTRAAKTPTTSSSKKSETPKPTPAASKLSDSGKKVAAEQRARYRDANGSKNHESRTPGGRKKAAARSPKSGDTPPSRPATPDAIVQTAPVDPKPEIVATADPQLELVPAPAGRAAEIAAAHAHVSPTLVKDAVRIQSENPSGFQAIKEGTSTVNAEKTKLQAEQKKAQELADAFQRIENVAGKALADAARDGTRLKGRKEVLAYAACTDEQMLQIRGLIEDQWSVAKALKYKLQTLCRTHRISDLITRAAANQGMYTLLLGDWEINVTKRKATT